MIIPSDQVLNKSVEYYDPSRRVVYLERDFWQKYFSMLLRDFSTEMGRQPSPIMKRRLASMVKDVLYDYWHTKFVKGEAYHSSLWREINRCFMSVSTLALHPREVQSFESVRETHAQAVEADITQEMERRQSGEKTADGSEVVDELVNDYSQMEYDSLREIEMEVVVEEASRNFYNEKQSIARVKEDYEKGRFRKYMKSDINFSSISDMVFTESFVYKNTDHVSVGEVTLWNLIDTREVIHNCKHTLQDFTIARFHNFYKQYSRILVFSRLVQRIGYDICELIYKGFMKNMVFNYVNVYEYVFCTIFLCDFCKRSIYSRSKYVIDDGFISMIQKGNTQLFGESFSGIQSPFTSSSVSDRASVIVAKSSKPSLDSVNSALLGNSKRTSIFSQDGGNMFSNTGSDFVFGQK